MLNKTIINKINKEIATDYNGVIPDGKSLSYSGCIQPNTGLNYNDKNQLRKAINIAENAKNDYKYFSVEEFKECLKYLLIALSSANENSKKSFSEFSKYLCIAMFSAQEAFSDSSEAVKYKSHIRALKAQLDSIAFNEYLEEVKNIDLDFISLIDTLKEILEMNVVSSKYVMKNNIKQSDIQRVDKDKIYLNNNNGVLSVSKQAYLSAKIKNDIKYGTSLVGSKVLNGASKVFKRISNKNI